MSEANKNNKLLQQNIMCVQKQKCGKVTFFSRNHLQQKNPDITTNFSNVYNKKMCLEHFENSRKNTTSTKRPENCYNISCVISQ
jgi:hypothetical protein